MAELAGAVDPSRPRVGIIDIVSAWTSVFQDPALVSKLVIGSALHVSCWLLLPLPFSLPVLVGYAVMATRNTVAGEEHPLPAWVGFSEMWLIGFWWIVAVIVYMLPFVLATTAVMAVLFAGLALGGQREEAVVAAVVAYYGLVFGSSLAGLVLRLTVFPVMRLQLARHGTLGSLFAFREMWDLFRQNPWNVLLTAVLEYVGGFLVSFGFLMCCLPAAPIWFLVQSLTAVNLGRAERLRMQAYGESIPA